MKDILRVGIIGAGSISDKHIEGFLKDKRVKIAAIADLNEKTAKEKAEKAGAERYYTDHRALLADRDIDAVTIATPTFTHASVAVEALEAGKHVMCEKPPALNASEAEAMVSAAKKAGKVLMFGFVCRFMESTIFLREFIDSGKMGRIVQAEAVRTERCSQLTGWFLDKKKAGGGSLIDGAIHELDEALYLMGYPEPVSVLGFASNVNNDLPGRARGVASLYDPVDRTRGKRTVESIASGFITFENGSCLYVKSGGVMNCIEQESHVELIGEKAGAKDIRADGSVKLLTLTENGYFVRSDAVLDDKGDHFGRETAHFVDCCLEGRECICRPEEGVKLMKIIDALYRSAETGKAETFVK